MIVFQNSGEIDLLTVTTFGCSVKEGTNPIGFFGTGLKFSLAVLLRTGHRVFIQSGATEVEITSQQDIIRGKDFGLVMVGDTRAGFTTELGKNWEVWMAYRELHCNAKDEPDSSIVTTCEHPLPVAGITRVIVDGPDIEKTHKETDKFILQSKPLYTIGPIEVHPKSSDAVFYRGIKVMNMHKTSLFTYNFMEQVDLTEDRTAKDVHAVTSRLAIAVFMHGEKAFLEPVISASTDTFESTFDLNWTVEPSADFLPTVGELVRHSLSKINPSALKCWRDRTKKFIEPRRIKPTQVQLKTVERAVSFAENAGFMLRNQYPIFIVETLGEGGVLAMADKVGKQIFLTERLFQSGGTKGVASALVEEYIHLRYGYDDCSRQMQNFLFEKLITIAEEMSGEPL